MMATRIEKKIECDRAGCRRRTGVEQYCLTLRGAENVIVSVIRGELCPSHKDMAVRFIENLFKNTKEYPADPED